MEQPTHFTIRTKSHDAGGEPCEKKVPYQLLFAYTCLQAVNALALVISTGECTDQPRGLPKNEFDVTYKRLVELTEPLRANGWSKWDMRTTWEDDL